MSEQQTGGGGGVASTDFLMAMKKPNKSEYTVG